MAIFNITHCSSDECTCWSGTPYFFSRALERALNERVSPLSMKLSMIERIFVGLVAILYYKVAPSGLRAVLQHTKLYLNWISFRKNFSVQKDDLVIIMTHLVPSSIIKSRAKLIYYFDQSLFSALNTYPEYKNADRKVKSLLLQEEQNLFERCEYVYFHSNWARLEASAQYPGLAWKFKYCVPGANLSLDRGGREITPIESADTSTIIKILFVGSDYKRKRLYTKIIPALMIVAAKNSKIRIKLKVLPRVEHNYEEVQVPENLFIEYIDFIDKSVDEASYVDLLLNCDFGVLSSDAEAGGMILREGLMLGLPFVFPSVGGSMEHIGPAALFSTSPSESIDAFALKLESCIYQKTYAKKRLELASLDLISLTSYERSCSTLFEIIFSIVEALKTQRLAES